MRKLKGALVAAVMFGGGMAIAQEQPQPEPLPMGSGAATETAEAQEQKTELTGTVIRAETEEDTLYVRNEQGESVELKVNEQTEFEDPSVRRLDDLSAGQEVRASYSTESGENVASTISLKKDKEDKAMGGSGEEGIDTGMREKDQTPPPPVTPEPGTGGSGDLTAPDAGTYDPMPDSTQQDTGGSGIDHPGSMEDPNQDVNQPVDMQQ
ncbi:MAG TPA: hypothetical protein VK013_00130 [Myxococcaceae bacterium]|nr:hypothetical protein [Myxococcaceae bacterium]